MIGGLALEFRVSKQHAELRDSRREFEIFECFGESNVCICQRHLDEQAFLPAGFFVPQFDDQNLFALVSLGIYLDHLVFEVAHNRDLFLTPAQGMTS